MRKFILLLLTLASLSAVAQTLSLVQAGGGNSATVTVTSSGLFTLVFEASDNWGLSQWYDLVNDPAKSNNIIGPLGNPNNPCVAEPGLVNYTFYGENDEKLFYRNVSTGCLYPNSPRSMKIITNTPSLIVLESTGVPTASNSNSSKLAGTVRYSIQPNGKIYVNMTIHVKSGTYTPSTDFVMFAGLEDPTKTIDNSIPPDTKGWIRATAHQNPYSYYGKADTYVFAYWNQGTNSPYYSTKASILIVPDPKTPYLSSMGQIIHSWDSGKGYGVVRWGYQYETPPPTLWAGQSLSSSFLVQLGTKNSSVLPDLTTSKVAGPIAAAYLANPKPPSAN